MAHLGNTVVNGALRVLGGEYVDTINIGNSLTTGALEIKGIIAGDSGSTGHGLYGGGGYHNAYNNILLHGDSSTATSGIAFMSDKVDSSGTVTNVNQPSDRAFIQYHAYGITTATAEGTNPTLATSGENGRLVIGIGNDATDQVWLQTPSRTGLIHQVGNTSYVIPDTNNTTGSVGSATQPSYVEGGVIKACTYSLNKTVPSDAVFTDTNNAITQTATTTSANYEVLFSATADNTTRTEGARKNSNLKFNPSTGNLQATQLNGVAIGSSPKFTDNNTTYTFATGDSNGQIKVTPSGGSAQNISVKGLGSNAYTSTAYLPLAGGTMTGQIKLASTGFRTSNDSGYSIDQYGNFKSLSSGANNNFQFQDLEGNAKVQIFWDTGSITASSFVGSIANATGLTKSQVTTALGYTPPTTNTTYSAMSTSELTTGTATTSRVVRADYLKSAIETLIHLQTYYFTYSTVSTLVNEVFAYDNRIVIVANWSDSSQTVFPAMWGTAIFLPCHDNTERVIYYVAGTMDQIRTYSGKIKKTSTTAAQVSWSTLNLKTDITKNLTF